MDYIEASLQEIDQEVEEELASHLDTIKARNQRIIERK